MNITHTLKDPRMGEEIIFAEASNGMQVAVCPKRGFSAVSAHVGLRFGSTDTRFRSPEGAIVEVPDGSAHFLEHKLFEGRDEKVFDRFGAIGAQFNGGTGFRSTNYWFASSGRFGEGLDILMDFVQSPLITPERVEKEKGIIVQEVRSYEDSAPYRGIFLLHRAMYTNHPIRMTPGGAVSEVQRTTADDLQACFDAFYRPHQLRLVLAGDLIVDDVLAQVEALAVEARPGDAERLYPDEPTGPAAAQLDETFSVSRPHVWMGWRDKDGLGLGAQALRRRITSSLVLDLALDVSSPLHEELYLTGQTDDSLSYHYSSDSDWGHAVVSGLADDPEVFVKGVRWACQRLAEQGVSEVDFQRIKRASWGNVVSGIQTPGALAGTVLNSMLNEQEPFAVLDVLNDLTSDELTLRARELFDTAQSSVAILHS
ncbi:MAG: insulinase family protein [Planctomycetes bacterium]|jgi:predicted Zn-dependent peptidase|nr:insulinase family protein [Planctomycetota bacterium]MBT4561016.1 insulinase family protein [Planctomycetota bacterium]